MTEYDNTNRGSAFPPKEDARMILEGKLDIQGRESRAVIVKRPTKTGKDVLEVYQKVGAMWLNDRKKGDKDPDYTGVLEDGLHSDKRIAAWRKQSQSGQNFMSLSVSDKQQQQSEQALQDDDIPF
jgi:hypothetical protein